MALWFLVGDASTHTCTIKDAMKTVVIRLQDEVADQFREAARRAREPFVAYIRTAVLSRMQTSELDIRSFTRDGLERIARGEDMLEVAADGGVPEGPIRVQAQALLRLRELGASRSA